MGFGFKDYFSCILIVLFAILMFFPIFNSGFLVSLDNPIHLAESYSFIENIKENKWVSGWSMDAYVGYPLQLFPRYQTGLWLVAILNLVFSMPVELAYKIVLFLSYLFPALAMFFVVRKLFGKTLVAFIPSMLFLFIRRDVVVTALTGQWNSLLALGFLIIFLYLTHKFFLKPNIKSSVLLSIMFAILILSHPFAAFAAALFFSIYFLVYWVKRGFSFPRFSNGIIAFIVGVLLCAFYVLPLLDMPGWLDTKIGWPPTYNALALPYKVLAPFIFAVPKGVVTSQLFSVQSFSELLGLAWLYFVSSIPQLLIFILGILGLFYLFESWKNKDSATIFLVSLFIFMVLSVIIGSGFWFLIPSLKDVPIFSNFQSYRFLVYANVSMLIFGSYALFNIFKGAYPVRLEFLHGILSKKFLILSLVALFLVVNINAYLPDRPETITIEDSVIKDDFFSLADWVRLNVDGAKTRIVYQDFYGNVDDQLIGSSHLPSMLFHYTDVYSVGGWYQSSSYPTDMLSFTSNDLLFGKGLDSVNDSSIAYNMMLVNAQYIVSSNEKLKSKLAGSNLFKQEFSNNRFAVFSLNGYNPEWFSHPDNLSYRMIAFDDNIILFSYNSTSQSDILVKATYHPYWRAFVDDKEVKVSRSADNLMMVSLPEGSHDAMFSYDPFNLSYLIVTLITLMGCVFVLLFAD